MKKTVLLLALTLICAMSFAQNAKPEWTSIISDKPETFQIQLVSSSENSVKVNVQVPGFYTTNVVTPRGEANIISLPKSVSTAQAGEPNVPMTGIPVMIGDQARMSIRVLDAKYQDFTNIEVAPSKGDFPRTIDPSTVPYTYGECFNQDAFFPSSNVDLYEPYIIRDFRGQNMAVYPFAYNPVSKTLRVYYDLTIEMYKVDDNGVNVMKARKSNTIKMDQDFKSLYERHFINYEASMAKYTPVDEEGDLLIICYDNFLSAMTDFVNWKKTRGVNTTIVGTSTISSSLTYSNLKTYIQNQYNANNNLTHVLLVGDVAQIPGYSYSGGGSSYSGLGDNAYGQVVGGDIYNDIFIGRFSASSTTQVTTQVNRTITYEKGLTTSATWCQNGLGISASAGNGGHYDEDDYEHIENLRTDLLNFGYSTVYQDYKSVSGYASSTTTTISNHINSGVGIINYCNHGEETGWQSHYYMNSNVNALTNDNKLPFIFSVACLVGKYDYTSSDCFAETWMHATNGSNPTGAIGGMFSYISQPWIPPMWAQDEFVDILVESYSNNIKHSLGGAAINGLFSIFDNYSTSTAQAVGTYQAWVLYGDPTLMLRTKTPQDMTVNHLGSITTTDNSYSVNVSNADGALATITDASHNILGKATVSGGTANISISGDLTNGDELTLCVFGYNKVTYLGTINVTEGGGTVTNYTISASANPSNGGTITGAGTYESGTTCTLTATPATGYTFSKWTKNGVSVSTNATYSFTVNATATYVANFTLNSYNVTATANPTEGGTVTVGSKGDKSDLYYDFEDGWQNWTVLKGTAGTSTHNWMHNTEYVAFDSNGNQIIPECHNSSSGMMLSESYISAAASGGSGSAVTPDNYLVSPQIRLGGSISFYAAARMSNYPAEKFSVLVSESGNSSTSNFTHTELTVTLTDNSWNEYTVDLSSYSGMGYVAIRHYDCYDQHLLYIDDVTIVEGDDNTTGSGNFNHGESCTVTATPNTGYQFVNWTEGGTAVSSDASYTFTVTSDRDLVANFSVDNQTATQTTQFSSGWNWWTPNVDLDAATLLAQLKQALGTNGIKIISPEGKFLSYDATTNTWSGNLFGIEVGKMYKFNMSSSCEITLTGPAIDETGNPIVIYPGNNWFGFFGTGSMSVNQAMSNFTPTQGDKIIFNDKFSTYNGSSWVGTLSQLVPGNGYIYKSNATTSQTLIFHSAK